MDGNTFFSDVVDVLRLPAIRDVPAEMLPDVFRDEPKKTETAVAGVATAVFVALMLSRLAGEHQCCLAKRDSGCYS